MNARDLVDILLEGNPDSVTKGYALELGQRTSATELLADMRSHSIQSPQCWGFFSDFGDVTFSGLYFGHGEAGARQLISRILREHQLMMYGWRFERHYTAGEQRHAGLEQWWKFTFALPKDQLDDR